jgi:hypothetical protein
LGAGDSCAAEEAASCFVPLPSAWLILEPFPVVIGSEVPGTAGRSRFIEDRRLMVNNRKECTECCCTCRSHSYPWSLSCTVVQLDAGDESETSRALRIDPWHLLSPLGADSYDLVKALRTSIESYMSLYYPILRVSRKSTASLNLNHAFPNQTMGTQRIVTQEMSIVKYRESQRSHNCVNRLSSLLSLD